MDTIKKDLEEIIAGVEHAAETKFEIWKLKIIVSASATISSALSTLAMIVILVITILLGSIAASYKLGEYLGNTADGFLIVSGVYVIITIIFICFRRYLIKEPVQNRLNNKMYNTDE